MKRITLVTLMCAIALSVSACGGPHFTYVPHHYRY
jgi:hypothetical protein